MEIRKTLGPFASDRPDFPIGPLGDLGPKHALEQAIIQMRELTARPSVGAQDRAIAAKAIQFVCKAQDGLELRETRIGGRGVSIGALVMKDFVILSHDLRRISGSH